ncbi:MAG: TIGR03862 family flavoprotein [Cyanobacteria bacterium SZAS LIN-2]|nr:TIGR03862 family flavoprotein [Cyanobacteria bacterium SZAS LIN-3]MBS1995787.1 TIGR03862 family flavoprotein [Cyanobacteria bacterium SZAS LIN-2]MBS2009403.1 TIGR03862 family flavoprotein [Cyanobacteria bacterium SZAS TMP-1]
MPSTPVSSAQSPQTGVPHLNGRTVAIIGGGPAGLMAAEVLIGAGATVDVYEAMPTLGRKFLRAGLGGLNITHSEPFADFCSRYGDKQGQMQVFLNSFPPDALRSWVHELGIKTFVGSSGRVFPTEMKAAPLLRAWVHRLRTAGVQFHMNTSWLGFDGGMLRLAGPTGEFAIKPDAAILALGGASWPQLGSTGTWLPWLQEHGVKTSAWQSANCGFNVEWSTHLREKFPADPLKSISLTFTDLDGKTETRQGELMIKEYGVEGSLIYAFSRRLREYINAHGQATFTLDLLPARSGERVLADLSRPRGSRSVSRHLQSCLGDNALKRALLYEVLSREQIAAPAILAKNIKALPIRVKSTRPLAEAISTAGGVSFDSIDQNLMLKNLPGIFVAGEMLDWEAPTGGYLLSGCFSTGLCAGRGAAKWLSEH